MASSPLIKQSLQVPGKLPSSHIITDKTTGYNSTPFAGKDDQLDKVMDELDRQGFVPENLIEHETNVRFTIDVFLLVLVLFTQIQTAKFDCAFFYI